MVKVLVPDAVQGVFTARPLHASAASTTETETVHEATPAQPGGVRSEAFRRRRAPVEQGVVDEQVVAGVVEVELEEVGTGNRTLICPEAEVFGMGVEPAGG